MRIRTVENLYDHLSDEIAWRRKELTGLRVLIETKSFSESKRDALIRAGVALLYAHWEGFIKAAATAYLEFVSLQRMRYEELAPNFIAISVKSRLNEAAGASNTLREPKFLRRLVNAFVSTNSNHTGEIGIQGLSYTVVEMSSDLFKLSLKL